MEDAEQGRGRGVCGRERKSGLRDMRKLEDNVGKQEGVKGTIAGTRGEKDVG